MTMDQINALEEMIRAIIEDNPESIRARLVEDAKTTFYMSFLF